MTVFPMARIAFRNLFTRPATRRYPFVVRPSFEKSRGRIVIDFDACILCGSCQRHCPANAFVVDRNAGRWWIDRFRCVNCGICVEVCPKKCLFMENERSKSVVSGDQAGREEEHIRPPAPKPQAPAAPAQPSPDA